MTTKSLAGALVGSLLMATALTPVGAADMTTERQLNPEREPQNWILHHGNYQGHRFSLLKEINTDTVKNMKPVFTVALSGFQSGGRYAHGNLEATPLVEDGTMYLPDGWGTVYAIDVSAGKKGVVKWKMDPGVDRAWAGDVACCGVNNRGVALWKDKVISIALDGRMFAINKATGEVAWERKIAEPALGETLTIAPLVIRDLAIVGAAGGEFGIRGYIEATDLNTGKAAWRTYTIPGTGEPGNETWKDGKEHWRHGGGSVWETATYDAESDTFYQGIGNAGPDFDPEYRPGDNKWAASVLAINPNDGKIKWGYQYTPNDPYDFDEISEHPIINAKVNGEDRKLVVHAARNGFFYALDRTNGSFIAGKQYVDELNWTPGLDPKTGKPLNYDPNADLQTYAPGTHSTRGAAGRRQAVPRGIRRQELAAQRLQSATRAYLHSIDRGLPAFENYRAHDEALRQRAGLAIQLGLRLVDRHFGHAITPAVFRVPFIGAEPAHQINAGLRAQRDHVISEQLRFEGRKQFVVPAALGLDDSGEGIEQLAI